MTDVFQSVISDAKRDERKKRKLAKSETKIAKAERANDRIALNTAAVERGKARKWDAEFFDSVRSKVAADMDGKQIRQEHMSVMQGIANETHDALREYAIENGTSGGHTADQVYEDIKAKAIS
ncbi:MAG: hypothetical protein EBY29_11715, partial [Planctomycetes bacterium]|nr:hypothetical protein [Planctomycetota bacterium]